MTGLLQFLLLDIPGQTLRNGQLTLANTGSHHCMCQDGRSLNQLTLMVLLKIMSAWVQQELCVVLLTQLQTLATRCVTSTCILSQQKRFRIKSSVFAKVTNVHM